MPAIKDASLELRMMVLTKTNAASSELSTSGLSFKVDGDVANWNALLAKLDPDFVAEVDKIDRSDQLSPTGQRAALLTIGESVLVDIGKWREKYVSFLEKRAKDLQATIDAATTKLFAPPHNPTQIATLATRLAAFSQAEIAALYIAAEPGLQVAIEAVAALTGGKIPLRGVSWPQWVDMIPEDIRVQEVAERNAAAAPQETKERSYLLFLAGAYNSLANSAAKLVETALETRGAFLPSEPRFFDPATGEQLSVPPGVALGSASTT